MSEESHNLPPAFQKAGPVDVIRCICGHLESTHADTVNEHPLAASSCQIPLCDCSFYRPIR